MITKFEELFDDIVYDWPFEPHKHPKIIKHDDGFEIDKTFIYEKEGKFYKEYKKDRLEITEEVFNKMKKLYDLIYGE